MYSRLSVFGCVAGGALALASPVIKHICAEIQIPVSVSVPRFIINTTVNDNWDAVDLTFNLTRQDPPTLIAGSTPVPVNSTYNIGATLCGNGGPTLVLTHGIVESKGYWRPNLDNASQYSLVDAAIAAGYSVLSYDRIGVGSSSKVDPYADAQFQVEIAVLNSLVNYARTTGNASKVALVGHSYGSYISAASASEAGVDVDAVILTGFSGGFDYFAPFLAGAGFRVARTRDPKRWGALGSAYLTVSDLYAATYGYFAGAFEHRVAEWSYAVDGEPFAVGELLSLLAVPVYYGNITAPVFLLQGRYDLSACGGNCVGALDEVTAKFTSARGVKIVDDLPAGHNLNLHTIAPKAFGLIFEFLQEYGI
ncbi:alpha/beta-hydrolase [Truncatella angustata]|uniref:Alpha/beta-hydrolase n=1 Tax=Truncatella angustata TaxID=152316 RepID=A0A9P8UGP1_9PEZI|nr:alpha/beta-hydrolase [Truncatella angustata]KAH6651997.1 alpha/beta-hydrolase [Truncatella angustata]KAH8205718.1 hypothetical protein TruAng_000212 [Truncatella angustata]